MDIISLLQNDHRNIETLIHGLETTERRLRRQVFDELRAELELHAQSVEEFLYPQKLLKDRKIFFQSAKICNQDILRQLNDLDSSEANAEEWGRLVAELKIMVARHVQSEENLFPLLEESLNRDELLRWGSNLLACKLQLKKIVHSAAS